MHFARRCTAMLLALTGLIAALGAGAQQALPQSPAEAAAIEKSRSLPLTPFYDFGSDLSATQRGALLRKEAVADYTGLPAGTQAVRILYHSLDSDGVDVATSGVVLVPPGNAPPGGWPVIAWAHGTTGVARACAPTLAKNLSYATWGLGEMVGAGFAVVATDYRGLGTPGPHRYMDKQSQAWDVIYSVPAARAAVPGLSAKWVVSGHSQGGAAAWGVAELQTALKDPDYLGAVSIAGATQMKWALANHPKNQQTGHYLAWRAYAIQAYFPDYDPRRLLTPAGMAYYKEVTNDGCFLYGLVSYAKSGIDGLLQPDWGKSAYVRHHFEQNEVGIKPVAGPIFVIAGEGDRTVPIDATRYSVRNACANRATVAMRTYPGLDHVPAMTQTVADQIAWIRDRFAGKPAPSTCPP